MSADLKMKVHDGLYVTVRILDAGANGELSCDSDGLRRIARALRIIAGAVDRAKKPRSIFPVKVEDAS